MRPEGPLSDWSGAALAAPPHVVENRVLRQARSLRSRQPCRRDTYLKSPDRSTHPDSPSAPGDLGRQNASTYACMHVYPSWHRHSASSASATRSCTERPVWTATSLMRCRRERVTRVHSITGRSANACSPDLGFPAPRLSSGAAAPGAAGCGRGDSSGTCFALDASAWRERNGTVASRPGAGV